MKRNKFYCPRCFHPDIKLRTAKGDGRPEFKCVKCGFTWTMGKVSTKGP